MRTFASPGAMTVDWEERVNLDRLRTYRFGRARAALDASDLGALLLFDFNNIRYVTSTHIGEWARDKMTRYALLTRGGAPHIWDFGSAAKHHRLQLPVAARQENIHAGMVGLRGAVAPGRRPVPARPRARSARSSRPRASRDMPLGVDIAEPPMVAALEAEGITVRDGQQVMLDAREVKSIDEIMLLNTACAMVDGAYQMHLRSAEARRPRERPRRRRHASSCSTWGRSTSTTSTRSSGERCSPHPHVFSDRIIRPGDQAFFDIIHTFIGYKTCYYRTFVVGTRDRRPARRVQAAREWIDASIELMRPGRRRPTRSPACGRRPRSSGSRTRWSASGSSSGTASACSSTSGRSSAASTRSSIPVELKEGMVIALETYCPAKDGYSAARIEEEVVVTADGAAGHHVVPVAKSCSSRTRTEVAEGRRSMTAAPRADLEIRLAHLPEDAGVPPVREARPGAVLRGPGPRDDASRRRARRPSPRGSRPPCEPDDWTFCTYRGHNHALPRGAPMARTAAPSCSAGRTACCGGKGGSMHLTDVEHGAMGSLRDRRRAPADRARARRGRPSTASTGQVAVCFFGDGTTNIGAFHEALNLAAVWKAPVVFVCENNRYMEYTAIGERDRRREARGRPRVCLRPGADRGRRQRRRRGVRGRDDGRWPARGPARVRR